MNRMTLAISAGAATTVLMLAILTLTGAPTQAADAQTGNPKQAVALKISAPLECNAFSTIQSSENHHSTVVSTHESVWKSWTPDDLLTLGYGNNRGHLHLIDGTIDRATDVYTIKGLLNFDGCVTKITIQGHCDSSWMTISTDAETLRMTNAPDSDDRFDAACYGN